MLWPESLESSPPPPAVAAELTAKPAEDPLCWLLEALAPVLADGVGQLYRGSKGKKQQLLQRCFPVRGNSGLLLFLPGVDYEHCFTESGKVYLFLERKERCGVFGLCS